MIFAPGIPGARGGAAEGNQSAGGGGGGKLDIVKKRRIFLVTPNPFTFSSGAHLFFTVLSHLYALLCQTIETPLVWKNAQEGSTTKSTLTSPTTTHKLDVSVSLQVSSRGLSLHAKANTGALSTAPSNRQQQTYGPSAKKVHVMIFFFFSSGLASKFTNSKFGRGGRQSILHPPLCFAGLFPGFLGAKKSSNYQLLIQVALTPLPLSLFLPPPT